MPVSADNKLENFLANYQKGRTGIGIRLEILRNLTVFRSPSAVNQLMEFLSQCGVIYINIGQIFSKKCGKQVSSFAIDENIGTLFEHGDNSDISDAKAALLDRFKSNDDIRLRSEFSKFCSKNDHWLSDYSVFCALADEIGTYDFSTWPDILRVHTKRSVEAVKNQLHTKISDIQVLQFFAKKNLTFIVECANKFGISVCCDCDIFREFFSHEVWGDQNSFFLDNLSKPTVFAGLPPNEAFPNGIKTTKVLFRISELKRTGYELTDKIFSHCEQLFDAVFLTNAHAISQVWEVPSFENDARSGRWKNTSCEEFFKNIGQHFVEFPYFADFNEPSFPDNEVVMKRQNIFQVVVNGEPYAHTCKQYNLDKKIFAISSKMCNRKASAMAPEKISLSDIDDTLHLARSKNCQLCVLEFGELLHIAGMRANGLSLPNTSDAAKIRNHISKITGIPPERQKRPAIPPRENVSKKEQKEKSFWQRLFGK